MSRFRVVLLTAFSVAGILLVFCCNIQCGFLLPTTKTLTALSIFMPRND